MSHRSLVLIGIVAAALILPARAQAITCTFDTDGDSVPNLVLGDVDDDGLCEFPDRKTHLPGTLRFTADTPVEFRGEPIVEADQIIIEEGALLRGSPETLEGLTIMALVGDLESRGTIDVQTRDDLALVARHGAVTLTGPTSLGAADRLLVDARAGDLVVAPPSLFSTGSFTLFGGGRVELRAKGALGDILIARTAIGGRRISVDGGANVSLVDPKHLSFLDGALLTTATVDTGLTPSGDIVLGTSGPIEIVESVLHSGRNLRLFTRRTSDDLCIGEGAVLEALDAAGREGKISLTSVLGGVRRDGRSLLIGSVSVSRPVIGGGCGTDVCVVEPEEATSPEAGEPDGASLVARAVPSPEDIAKQFTKLHTDVRTDAANNTPKPKPTLKPVAWDNDLAGFAAELAGPCVCKHRQGAARKVNGQTTGENLWKGSASDIPNAIDKAVASWKSEKNNFDYDDDVLCTVKKKKKFTIDGNEIEALDGECGHYTQLVWHDSTTIGCAVQFCTQTEAFVVCNYLKAGNVLASIDPFKYQKPYPK